MGQRVSTFLSCYCQIAFQTHLQNLYSPVMYERTHFSMSLLLPFLIFASLLLHTQKKIAHFNLHFPIY